MTISNHRIPYFAPDGPWSVLRLYVTPLQSQTSPLVPDIVHCTTAPSACITTPASANTRTAIRALMAAEDE